MPSASDEDRELMRRWFGSIEMSGPMEFLWSHGFTFTRDFLWKTPTPSHTVSKIELACIYFLCDEWDCGGLEQWEDE